MRSIASSEGAFTGSRPPAHGRSGNLVNLMVSGEHKAELRAAAARMPNVRLDARHLCDLEMLLCGAFSPLTGFMDQSDYDSVVLDLQLADGTVWPIPITLAVTWEKCKTWTSDGSTRICLVDTENTPLAVMTITSIWQPDKAKEALHVLGSADDTCHPYVEYLLAGCASHYVGGTLEGITMPKHYDYGDIRLTPRQLRSHFDSMSWENVVGFQTRNPMHKCHRELVLRSARLGSANIVIHPAVGVTNRGDVDYWSRVRCYKEVMRHLPRGMATLSLMPLSMRMAGPREALWHAIIRQNYGCTHFVVGRDHAGPGKDRNGEPFYDTYAAHEMVKRFASRLRIQCLCFEHLVYVEDMGEYMPTNEVPEGARTRFLSGTELRRRLNKGLVIPEWFTFKQVVHILRQTYPPRHEQGVCVFFTGLSAAGKSTLAKALLCKLRQDGRRQVTILDGDEVRTNLSSNLTFSKEDRDRNILRIGYVASLITRHRGIAICAAIAPYAETRRTIRHQIQASGAFLLIHVATPLNVCEHRDPKGLYALAREGKVTNFTGIDDPYEEPTDAELVLDTSVMGVNQAVNKVILLMEQEGWLGSVAGDAPGISSVVDSSDFGGM